MKNLSPAFAFIPANQDLDCANIFLQDVINLDPRFDVTAGLKLERNAYTGLEALPELRLAFRPEPSRLLWGSWSRPVRAPSRIDREFYVPDAAAAHFRAAIPAGEALVAEWEARLEAYALAHPAAAAEFRRRIEGTLAGGWDADLKTYEAGSEIATHRNPSTGKVSAAASVVGVQARAAR